MVTFDPERDIENYRAVASIFGGWPSFHDAEILQILLQRGPGGPSLECTIHVWQVTGEVDETRHYVTTDHTLLRLRFTGLYLRELSDFNQQNVIYDLKIRPSTDATGRFTVLVATSHGCEADFDCDAIRVVAVEPYTEERMASDGSVYSKGPKQ